MVEKIPTPPGKDKESLIGEKLPPAEPGLRRVLLERIEGIQSKDLDSICGLFRSVGAENDPGKIKTALSRAVTSAKLGKYWLGTERENVAIGYYASEGEYFATFMHEAAHNMLEQLDYTGGYKAGEGESEENFCWRFSKVVCRLLELPYNEKIEELNRKFAPLYLHPQDYTREELSHMMDDLVRSEREIRGISEDGGDRFHFSPEGVPIKD